MCAPEQPYNSNNTTLVWVVDMKGVDSMLYCLRKHNGAQNDPSYVLQRRSWTPAEGSSITAYHQRMASVLDVASNDEQ